MNVLVTNEQQRQLQTLEVDIIKSVNGTFEARELIDMFKDFFFNKMIIDVTALNNYNKPATYKTLVGANGISPDKVIFFFKEGSKLCTSGFLSQLIQLGIYNFTTNLAGVRYLIDQSNTYDDVKNILKMSGQEKNRIIANNDNHTTFFPNQNMEENKSNVITTKKPFIIGFKNLTTNAGATTLIYMLMKELTPIYNNKIIAIELEKNDFLTLGNKQMISIPSVDITDKLRNLSNMSIILIDLNDTTVEELCTNVIYLIEPSTIKLNNLIRKNKAIIQFMKNKNIVLNKSLLSTKDVGDFENEAGIKILYNMPPLNDRKRNEIIIDFSKKIGLIKDNNYENDTNKIFGLFRK